ncbi:histone [Candidatus Micrarchaeota archaeon]|nr:MAG: histone [Candidatus Micrarchaeota archaeon]
MPEIPKSSVERLIRAAGAKRVSGEAAISLARILEDMASDISLKAVRLAKHAGRKTVTAEDIRLSK